MATTATATAKSNEQISHQLEMIACKLAARDELDAERRKVDDLRNQRLESTSANLVKRMDEQGVRTSTLETKWETFFDEKQGAWVVMMDKLHEIANKTDRQHWYIAIGVGILITLQVLFEVKH